MEQLAADEFYQSEGLKYSAKDGCPYMIAVNRAASTVTVLALDDEGNYTKPYMAMVCSGGADTPLGFFATPVNYDWRLLAGPSYGQYATRIWDSYLFHTVPYYSQHKDDIEYDQFNQLGTQASLGCIRLLVCDVKWIYDNCPIGTRVVIYDNADDPGPMGKPGTIYTDPTDESKRAGTPPTRIPPTRGMQHSAAVQLSAARQPGTNGTTPRTMAAGTAPSTPLTCRAGAPIPALRAPADNTP